MDEETTCTNEEDQSDYRGSISVTKDGYVCQAWTAQSPHISQKDGNIVTFQSV